MKEQKKRWIGYELKGVNNLIRRNLDLRFSQADLGDLVGMQGPIIGYLYAHTKERDVFQKDIERDFKIRRSTATGMLQGLEQKGLIVREAVSHDGRLKKIVLTQKAIQCHMRVQKQIDAFHRELEEGITAQEKEEFLRILDKINQNLKETLAEH